MFLNLNDWQKWKILYFLHSIVVFTFTRPFIKQVAIINIMLKWDHSIENSHMQPATFQPNKYNSVKQSFKYINVIQVPLFILTNFKESWCHREKVCMENNDWLGENFLFNLYWGPIDECSFTSLRYVESVVKWSQSNHF